jgi:hypothetical protein
VVDIASHPVLIETLRLAVPLWMDQLHHLHQSARDRKIRTWAADAADAVAHRGDTLQFGGKKGEAAQVFNHLARGLAAAAHQPGGITFAGEHWCTDHAACEDAAAWAAANPIDLRPEPTVSAPAVVTVEIPGVS